MSSTGQLPPSLGQLDTSSKAPGCLQEGHGEVWGGPGGPRELGTTFFSVENYGKKEIGGLMGVLTLLPALLTDPGREQQHLQQENLLLPGNKEGKGSREEDVFILPCSYIIPQECRPLAGSPQQSGAGPCSAAPLRVFKAATGCRGTQSGRARGSQAGPAPPNIERMYS